MQILHIEALLPVFLLTILKLDNSNNSLHLVHNFMIEMYINNCRITNSRKIWSRRQDSNLRTLLSKRSPYSHLWNAQKILASGKGFEPVFHRSKRCVLPLDEPEKLEALVRFELTTSRFVVLRSKSVELQSRRKFGRHRTQTRMRLHAAIFFGCCHTDLACLPR